MSFQANIVESYADGSGNVASGTYTPSGTLQYAYDGTVAATTANQATLLAFAHSTIQACIIYSSQAITLYTNAPSTGSPTQTISVPAGVPIIFGASGPGTNPFTSDVTEIYLSNAGSNSATVKIRVICT